MAIFSKLLTGLPRRPLRRALARVQMRPPEVSGVFSRVGTFALAVSSGNLGCGVPARLCGKVANDRLRSEKYHLSILFVNVFQSLRSGRVRLASTDLGMERPLAGNSLAGRLSFSYSIKDYFPFSLFPTLTRPRRRNAPRISVRSEALLPLRSRETYAK